MKREVRIAKRNGASHRFCAATVNAERPAASAVPLTTLLRAGLLTGPCPGVVLSLLLLTAPLAMAEETVRLTCEPHAFQVVPGEPIRLELTVLADSAAAVRVHVPSDPLLVLRAVEKLPVRRTHEGLIVHKRVVLWQALEPGTIKVKTISVETRGRKRRFPEISIIISDPGS